MVLGLIVPLARMLCPLRVCGASSFTAFGQNSVSLLLHSAHCGSQEVARRRRTPMERGLAAASGTTGSPESTPSGDFPEFPGEDFLAHAGTHYKEMVDARLAEKKLLGVAQSREPLWIAADSQKLCRIAIEFSTTRTLSAGPRRLDSQISAGPPTPKRLGSYILIAI